MSDLERLRAALATLAAETPDPGRVRAALTARTRAHRQRRLVLGLAGAGAAAAGLTAAGLALHPDRRTSDDDPAPVASPPVIPLGYRAGWLPDGFRETGRVAELTGGRATVAARIWSEPGGGVVAVLSGDPGEMYGVRPRTVDVNGVAGILYDRGEIDEGMFLRWSPPGSPGLLVAVTLVDDGPEQGDIALRVARSVVPDPGPRLVPGLSFGWVPPALAAAAGRYGIDVSGPVWDESLFVAADGLRLFAHRRPGPPEDPATGQLVRPQPDGTFVTVGLALDAGGETSAADLARAADALRVGPAPDLSWVR